MRAQPKKTKKKKKGGEREISTVCPSRGECYKAVIMPENEKWNKVVGARKGEAETETKSWKFRAQRVRRRSRFITYAKQKNIETQLKKNEDEQQDLHPSLSGCKRNIRARRKTRSKCQNIYRICLGMKTRQVQMFFF